MAYRLPAHLHRSRHGTLYFRIAIPTDLRHYFSMAEVYRTLRTARVADAALSAQTLALSFKKLFRQLREDSSMCATKKKTSSAGLKVGMIMELSLDEFRRPKGRITTEPGDSPAMVESAIRAMSALLDTPAGHLLQAPPTQTSVIASKPLSSYIEPYLSNAFTASRPDKKTLDSYRAAIVLFIDIIGDKPLHTLGVTDQNRFEDMIAKVPANRTKIAMTRALSLEEMTTLNVSKLSPQSAKNVAMRTNRFLTWAFRREGSKPPFELMGNVRITARSKTVLRRAFTDDELSTLFSPITYAQGRQQKPYMYWLPLIGLHSGMRINEIAQLALADIALHDGIMCFHVTDEVDDDNAAQGRRVKRVKTDAGRRIVPVHDALINLGLLDYVQTVREETHSVLFPELIGGRDGPGQAASKQFGRYCDRVGLSDPGLVFHSFRHGAVGRMRAAGVAKELRMVVVGHSAAEDTHDSYGDIKNDFNVRDRKNAIDALRFGTVLNYSSLKEQQPSLRQLQVAIARAHTRTVERR
jgi:integrase